MIPERLQRPDGTVAIPVALWMAQSGVSGAPINCTIVFEDALVQSGGVSSVGWWVVQTSHVKPAVVCPQQLPLLLLQDEHGNEPHPGEKYVCVPFNFI